MVLTSPVVLISQGNQAPTTSHRPLDSTELDSPGLTDPIPTSHQVFMPTSVPYSQAADPRPWGRSAPGVWVLVTP